MQMRSLHTLSQTDTPLPLPRDTNGAMFRAVLCSVSSFLMAGALAGTSANIRAQVAATPAPETPEVVTTGAPVPLLSLDAIHFLEGKWSATTRDGRTPLGTYSFVRELNGHVLSRHSAVDPGCDPVKQPACGRRDLFYVYQDSAGAPLKAISFDSEGHVTYYFVKLAVQASTSTLGQRDFVVFDSDPSQLGPRLRLRYEHSVDTQTGKDVLNGAFEMLRADGQFVPMQQWYSVRQ